MCRWFESIHRYFLNNIKYQANRGCDYRGRSSERWSPKGKKCVVLHTSARRSRAHASTKVRSPQAYRQAYVRLKGKFHYLGDWNTAKSREKYRRFIAEYISTGETPIRKRDGEVFEVREMILKFVSHAKRYYGEGPGSQYLRIKPALSELRKMFGTFDATKFGPKELKLLRSGFAATGDRSRQYINRLVKFVVHVFRWGTGEGLIPAEVSQALSAVPPIKAGRTKLKEAKPIKPVPEATITATLPHLSPVIRSMVEFQRQTGARPGEVCSLKPSMVDRSSDVWEIHLVDHKNAWRGKQRVIFVGKTAQDVLAPYLLRSIDDYCFRPSESLKNRRERTTPINQGNRAGYGGNRKPQTARKVRPCYSTATYGRAIRRACEANGIEPWAPTSSATPTEPKSERSTVSKPLRFHSVTPTSRRRRSTPKPTSKRPAKWREGGSDNEHGRHS